MSKIAFTGGGTVGHIGQFSLIQRLLIKGTTHFILVLKQV